MTPEPSKIRSWLDRATATAPLLLALSLLVLIGLRALTVEAIFGPNADCGGCMGLSSAGQDAWLLALNLGLLALAVAARSSWIRLPLMASALVLLILASADLAILTLLNARLYLLDVFKFGGELDASADFLRALLRAHPVVLPMASLGLGALIALCLRPHRSQPRQAIGLAASAGLALIAGAALSNSAPTHVNSDAFLNLWQLHRDQGVAQSYSDVFVQALAESANPSVPTCEAGQSQRPDVVVVLWESLSTYHSGLSGDWQSRVPQFDSIARRNTWFSAFHANGFTTDHGMIALLTGEYPVPQVGRYASLQAFAGFENPDSSVAGQLRPFDYHTAFFTTGDLGFLDKPSWLKAIGVDHWEGAEHPFYTGMPRGPFAAANDQALYQRFGQWQRDAAISPYFATLLTVESHPPFVHRSTGALDESATFIDADRAFGEFYRSLQADGFFENGILIVLGDHRSMTPLKAAERERFGDTALAVTPMLVAGASTLPKGEITLPFQQTDLLPSLLQMIAPRACHRPDQGRFLRSDPQPPAFIVHARGDQRSRVDIYTAQGNGALILRGDASEWIGHQPDNWREIADFLHAERIRRGQLESDIPAILRMLGRDQ